MWRKDTHTHTHTAAAVGFIPCWYSRFDLVPKGSVILRRKRGKIRKGHHALQFGSMCTGSLSNRHALIWFYQGTKWNYNSITGKKCFTAAIHLTLNQQPKLWCHSSHTFLSCPPLSWSLGVRTECVRERDGDREFNITVVKPTTLCNISVDMTLVSVSLGAGWAVRH